MWIRGDLCFWEDHIIARITMRKYHIVFFHTTQCGNNLGKHSEIIYEFISSVLTKNYTKKIQYSFKGSGKFHFFHTVFSVSFNVHTPFFFFFIFLNCGVWYRLKYLHKFGVILYHGLQSLWIKFPMLECKLYE